MATKQEKEMAKKIREQNEVTGLKPKEIIVDEIPTCYVCGKDVSGELPKIDCDSHRYCRSCYEKKCASENRNQKQIEKMIDVMCDSEDCIKAMNGGRLDTDYRVVAKTFIEAGYINGADFVEWLKERWSLNFECHNMTCVSAGDLDEALQEYLKGGSENE